MSRANQASEEAQEYDYQKPIPAHELAPPRREHRDPQVHYGVVDVSTRWAPSTHHEWNPRAEFTDDYTAAAEVVPFRVVVNQAATEAQAKRAKAAYARQRDTVDEEDLVVVPLSDTRGL